MYENADVEEVTIFEKFFFSGGEISTHFLTNMIPDIDEKLLERAVSMMAYK